MTLITQNNTMHKENMQCINMYLICIYNYFTIINGIRSSYVSNILRASCNVIFHVF